jgi:hypothetical protein
MRFEKNNMKAVICRSAYGRENWIICREFDGMIEGDEIAASRNGEFRTRKEAVAKAEEIAVAR